VDQIILEPDPVLDSGAASPKFFEGQKNLWWPKCLILGEWHYFVWDTASQRTK